MQLPRFVAIRGDSWRFAAIRSDLLISDTAHTPQDVRVLRHAAGELLLPAHGQLRPPDPVQHGADTQTTDAAVGALRPLHRVHVASWRTDHRLQAQP